MTNATTYQVIYNNIPIKSKLSLFSKLLGTLNEDDTIVATIYNNWWITSLYKGKTAYILTIYIKEIEKQTPGIKESITIDYIEQCSKTKLSTSSICSNLSLGTYTYNVIPIDGYNILGETSQSITLTSDEPNKIITFLYSKILE